MGLDQLVRSGIERAGEAAASHLPSISPPLRILQAAVTDLAEAMTVERLAAIVTATAKDGLEAELLLFGVICEDGGRHLRIVPAHGLHDVTRQPPAEIPIDGSGVLAQVARTGKPAYVERLPEAPGEAAGPGWFAVVPVAASGAPFGVMVLGRPRRPFEADDRAFLGVLADLCAHAAERLITLRRRAHSQVLVGRMEIDLEAMQIAVDGRSVALTPSEIRLLTFLAKEPGRPRTRRDILRHLWHTDHVGDERACDVHVSNLRRKIEADPSRPELVVTVRGVGYALHVSPA